MSGYIKNTWVNQNVERPKTYEVTTNADGSITLTDSFGLVTELGTPVNADNMNHIENGISKVAITEYDNTFTYSAEDWVTGDVNGQKRICRSKVDNNVGNALNDDTYWEILELGGGSGYQLFDIVWKDHILNYDETLGLVQAGSYMYKEAIAGTRYGYPETYQKLIDEYTDVNNTTDTVDGVTVTINANGHKFYDIADKATFDNMFAITGEAYYYGIDTTNERVFMPRLTRTKAGTTSDVGKYNPAGLPNVYAEINPRTVNTGSSPGTIGDASGMASLTVRGGDTDIATMTFGSNNRREDLLVIDASLNSNIYGASSTVEYASTKLIPYFVVGNTADWTGMSTVVNQGMDILSQVANKATTDLDNLTNAGKIVVANLGMPSNVTLPLTLPASNTVMTAPTDGYVSFIKKASASNQYIYLSNCQSDGTGDYVSTNGFSSAANQNLHVYLPVKKNDYFQVGYTAGGATLTFQFTYAQGSESEAL